MTERAERPRPRWAAIGLAVALTACGPSSEPGRYEFALLGDNPYPPENVPLFEALIRDVNARPGLAWVFHVGDIRGRRSLCSNEVISARFELYQRFEAPFVYTPGDNDWFDCIQESAGSFADYERLSYLRSVFYPDPGSTTGRRRMSVESQSLEAGYEDHIENVMWSYGGVVYATVHLIAMTRDATSADVADRRMDAALSWIAKAFHRAEEDGSIGVFIATQADLWPMSSLTRLDPGSGLESLYPALIEGADGFSGQVVLAVGDMHIYRVDKPLYRDDGSLVENFTRVGAFGDPLVHWVRVVVDPRDRQVFTFKQELVPGNDASVAAR